jgi:acetolactate synthase I/II/III large subunit
MTADMKPIPNEPRTGRRRSATLASGGGSGASPRSRADSPSLTVVPSPPGRSRASTRGRVPATPTMGAPGPAPAATPTPGPAPATTVEPRAVTAAVATASELKALGVECLFLMTGRDNTLWIALEAVGIRQLLARTEAAAVYMADGYARVTGRPAFVYGAYGPGAANVAGSLAEPFWSSSPVVALASAMRRTERHRSEYQELDQPKMFEPVTKWAIEASDAAQLPRLIRQAARRSVSGTPGPVYLGVPGDIYEETIAAYRPPTAAEPLLEVPLSRPAPNPADAEAAVVALARAARPVILAGNGIHQSAAWRDLERFAEHLRVPIVTSVAGKGAIAETHELALGTVGRYSRIYANAALKNADVVLAIGTRLGGMVTDSYKLISPTTHLIHVTLEAEAIGQNFATDLGLVADAKSFLTVALDAAEALPATPVDSREAYLVELAEQRDGWRRRRAEQAELEVDGCLRPEAIMAILDEHMADDAIVCADTGYASAWAGGLLDLRHAGRSFFRADGSLGWSFAGALGAQLAAPAREVYAIIGDGGFGYQVAEIETAARLDLPVVTIILNNRTLAFEAHVQTLLYDHLVPEVDDFGDVDYGEVARAFGANGVRVRTAAELRQALADARDRRVPTVIDALIDPDAIAPVTRYDRVRTREL